MRPVVSSVRVTATPGRSAPGLVRRTTVEFRYCPTAQTQRLRAETLKPQRTQNREAWLPPWFCDTDTASRIFLAFLVGPSIGPTLQSVKVIGSRSKWPSRPISSSLQTGTIAKDVADLCWVMAIGDGRSPILEGPDAPEDSLDRSQPECYRPD